MVDKELPRVNRDCGDSKSSKSNILDPPRFSKEGIYHLHHNYVVEMPSVESMAFEDTLKQNSLVILK